MTSEPTYELQTPSPRKAWDQHQHSLAGISFNDIPGCYEPSTAEHVLDSPWATVTAVVMSDCPPDVTFAVNVRAKQITIWSVNDDRRAARLLGCLSTTVDLAHLMVMKDPLDEFHLALYCGAISLEIQNDDVDFWLCHCIGRHVQFGSPVMGKPQTKLDKPQHNRIRICFAVRRFAF